MIRCGVAPYLECSSRGDKRLSAFYARPRSLSGLSIEQAYQAMKVFEDGSTNLEWLAAKGRQAVNQAECAAAYAAWWREWVDQEQLLPVLQAASGLSDVFGQEGHVCHWRQVLWTIHRWRSAGRDIG